MAENSSKGTAVGDPVTATDDDVLTYSIHDNDGDTDTRDDSDVLQHQQGQRSNQRELGGGGFRAARL